MVLLQFFAAVQGITPCLQASDLMPGHHWNPPQSGHRASGSGDRVWSSGERVRIRAGLSSCFRYYHPEMWYTCIYIYMICLYDRSNIILECSRTCSFLVSVFWRFSWKWRGQDSKMEVVKNGTGKALKENHRKTIGKCWPHGILWDIPSDNDYHS